MTLEQEFLLNMKCHDIVISKTKPDLYVSDVMRMWAVIYKNIKEKKNGKKSTTRRKK